MASAVVENTSHNVEDTVNIVKSKKYSHFSIVFFDLEATGLESDSEIIQIAAKYGEKTYNEYVIPVQKIPARITTLTGLSLDDDRKMYYRGSPVEGVSKAAAADNFLEFLKSVQSIGGEVVLVAHNCFNFDGPKITKFMTSLGQISEFKSVVAAFSDSLPLFKQYLPARKYKGKAQYTLNQLSKDFLENSATHSALDDVTTLEKLVTHDKINISGDDIIESCVEVEKMSMCRNRLHNDYNYSRRKFARKVAYHFYDE